MLHSASGLFCELVLEATDLLLMPFCQSIVSFVHGNHISSLVAITNKAFFDLRYEWNTNGFMLCVTLTYINGALVIRKMLHLTVRDVVLIAIREMILPNTTQYICFFFF